MRLRQACLLLPVFLLAYLPVLFGDYVRQDSMNWMSWPGIGMTERSDFVLIAFQQFRPLAMPFLQFEEIVGHGMFGDAWLRLLNIICVTASAFLLARWQSRFTQKRVFVLATTVAIFTLPGVQVCVATGNYFVILVSLLATILAVDALWQSLRRNCRAALIWPTMALGSVFLAYPFAPMFGWVMIAIAYLHRPNHAAATERAQFNRRLVAIAAIISAEMIGYYLLGRATQFIVLRAQVASFSTTVPYSLHIDPHLVAKLKTLLLVAFWQAHLWFAAFNENDPSAFLLIIVLFFLALLPPTEADLVPVKRRCAQFTAASILLSLAVFAVYAPTPLLASSWQAEGHAVLPWVIGAAVLGVGISLRTGLRVIARVPWFDVAVVSGLLIMSYAPALALPDSLGQYRYALTPMPLLLYVAAWSVDRIARRRGFMPSTFFVAVAVMAVVLCNLVVERQIAGPQTHYLAYARERLAQEVLPMIRQAEPVTVVIPAVFDPASPIGTRTGKVFLGEYGMWIWNYPGQAVASIIFGLRTLGVESVPGPRLNDITWGNDRQIVMTPWGLLMCVDYSWDAKKIATAAGYAAKYPAIDIDLRNADDYKPFSLYTRLF